MFQLGIVLFCAEGLLTGGYRDFGLNGLAAGLVAVLAVLSVVLLPRLAWRTRAWKVRAVIGFLGSCGFVAEDREPEKTSQ
jgi:hypothetical protein